MNKTKKFTKIFLIAICFLIVVSTLVYVAIGLFAPISWESGACSGGFTSYLESMCIEQIELLTDEEISEEEKRYIHVSYGDRHITGHLKNENGEEITIYGKKIFYGKYKWEII